MKSFIRPGVRSPWLRRVSSSLLLVTLLGASPRASASGGLEDYSVLVGWGAVSLTAVATGGIGVFGNPSEPRNLGIAALVSGGVSTLIAGLWWLPDSSRTRDTGVLGLSLAIVGLAGMVFGGIAVARDSPHTGASALSSGQRRFVPTWGLRF